MTDLIEIAEKASAVRTQWPAADIWEILDRLGIVTRIEPLGRADTGLKGYCTSFFGQFAVAVNQNLPSYLRAFIAWHELGHVILDPEMLRNGQYIPERDPLGMQTAAEMRANYFAAAGAVPDSDLLGLLHAGYTLHEAAAQLCVPETIAVCKVRILRACGEALPPTDAPEASWLRGDITGTENF